MIPSGTGASFGCTQIRGIAVGPKHHVTGSVADRGIWVSGTVVQKLCNCLQRGHGPLGLLGADCAQCNEQGRINSSGVIEENADSLLHVLLLGGIKDRRSVLRGRKLLRRDASGLLPGLGGMLWAAGHGMAETQQGTFNVARHGKVDSAVGVVPSEGEPTIAAGIPIFTDCIVLPKDRHEMLCIGTIGVFDCKVIHDKGKGERASVMLPQSRGDGARGEQEKLVTDHWQCGRLGVIHAFHVEFQHTHSHCG